MRKRMRKRIKKAAFYAALGYCSVFVLGFGMLRAAQQTRRTLYGGMPVMAQLSRTDADPDAARILSFGGGEWQITLPQADLSSAEQAAAQLPPSFGKLLLRLAILTERYADQTTEWISGM